MTTQFPHLAAPRAMVPHRSSGQPSQPAQDSHAAHGQLGQGREREAAGVCGATPTVTSAQWNDFIYGCQAEPSLRGQPHGSAGSPAVTAICLHLACSSGGALLDGCRNQCLHRGGRGMQTTLYWASWQPFPPPNSCPLQCRPSPSTKHFGRGVQLVLPCDSGTGGTCNTQTLCICP